MFLFFLPNHEIEIYWKIMYSFKKSIVPVIEVLFLSIKYYSSKYYSYSLHFAVG